MKKGLKIALGVGVGIVLLGALVGQQEPGTDTAPKKATVEAAPKEPAVPGITMAGYQRLQTGMSYREVVAILGKEGEELSSNEIGGTRTVMYQWQSGAFGGNMNAMFQDDKLMQKAQFGLK